MPLTTKYIFLIFAFVVVSVLVITHQSFESSYPDAPDLVKSAAAAIWHEDHGILEDSTNLNRYDLTRQECRQLLPQLWDEINLAKRRGPVAEVPRRDDQHGFVRARIHGGNLYVINRGEDVHHRQYATLSSIYRAVITTPRDASIPNIEFTFCVNDHPQPNIWSLARSDAPGEINNTWLMPDYGYWSWPEPQIGPFSQVRDLIAIEDRARSWDDKIDKAVWRGTLKWNKELRGKLLGVSQGKPWADIEELEWHQNDLRIGDFCKWQFLVYTEGVTYSGRLKYQQLCRSVIVTPEMKWRTFLNPLIQDHGSLQNVVIVKDDWTNLEEKIQSLRANPREAERIAENSVGVFRDLYASNSVETCYWRELFNAWHEVTPDVGEPVGEELGIRWESFMLMGKFEWDKHA